MVDWAPLRAALGRCRDTKTSVPMWWRDDDAIEPTAALEKLFDMSDRIGVPVYLATIPKTAYDTLVPFLRDRPNLVPCVHGWAHLNTAPKDSKKSEFGVQRDGTAQDLKLAMDRMTHLFGDGFFPLFVPPWNRMDASVQTALVQTGYVGFSTYGARTNSATLPQINTHIDPIFWRGHRGLADPSDMIIQAANILSARCDGLQDANEPFGLLTHHLVHVPEVWEFSKTFITEMLDGGAHPANLKEILT